MNLPPLVAADVRRLTLSQRVRREKDQSLVTSAATLDWLGSWPQCASEIRRCSLSMNLPSPGLAATLSHPMGEGLGVRALLRVGPWPQFACMSRWNYP